MKNGNSLEIINCLSGNPHNEKVTINDNLVPDGKYELEESNRKYLISNSQIDKLLVDIQYTTKTGIIFIEQTYNPAYPIDQSSPSEGDLVFQDNKPAPKGKYHLGILVNIWVEDGKIIKFSAL